MTKPEDVPEPLDVPSEACEEDYEEDYDERPAHPGKPPFGYHDAEAMLPPPVSGSTD